MSKLLMSISLTKIDVEYDSMLGQPNVHVPSEIMQHINRGKTGLSFASGVAECKKMQ